MDSGGPTVPELRAALPAFQSFICLGWGPHSAVLLACSQMETTIPCVSQSKTSLLPCPHTKS